MKTNRIGRTGCVADLAAQDTREMLRAHEAAAFLGISMSYLYKLTHYKSISYFKPCGGLLFFSRSDLESWASRNRIATNDELSERAMKEVRR